MYRLRVIILLTSISRQADRLDKFRDGDLFVEPQEGNVIVKVGQAELVGDSAQYKPGLGPLCGIAPVMLSKCHLYHEPHKAGNKNISNQIQIQTNKHINYNSLR